MLPHLPLQILPIHHFPPSLILAGYSQGGNNRPFMTHEIVKSCIGIKA